MGKKNIHTLIVNVFYEITVEDNDDLSEDDLPEPVQDSDGHMKKE